MGGCLEGGYKRYMRALDVCIEGCVSESGTRLCMKEDCR